MEESDEDDVGEEKAFGAGEADAIGADFGPALFLVAVKDGDDLGDEGSAIFGV